MAREFMKECGFTFRTVLDSSDEATQVAFSGYKACCVPLHYVIDKERKIVLAQPGFEEGYKTILGTLARLGVDTGVDPLPAIPVKRKQGPAKRGWEDPSEEDSETPQLEQCSLSGKVLDENHQPVKGRTLEVFSTEHAFNKRVKTSDEGTYVLESLKPGGYMVQFTKRPGRTGRRETDSPFSRSGSRHSASWNKFQQIEPGQAATIDFVPVKDAAVLSGEVHDLEGKPLSNCNLSISNIHHCYKEGTKAFSVNTSTDGHGCFVVDNLAPGTYDTTIFKSGEYCQSPTGEVSLEKGEEKEIILSLYPGRVSGWIEVEGDFLSDSDYPWIIASPAGDPFGPQWHVKAFSFSAFEIQNMPPGNFEVWAQLRGFFCEPQPFRVEKDGKADIVEITLKPAGSILFEVTDENGSPIESATITKVVPGKGMISTDMENVSSGVFRVHSVATGETRFRIESSGRGETEVTVSVELGKETAVSVKI